jgi:flavodoxin
MSALVVYESLYGNTREVAEAIASGLGDARVVSVHEALSHATKADLLVVGGPTHVHGLSSKRSRAAGVENTHGALESGTEDDPGLRDWLADLPRVVNARAAAFDTRAHGPRLLTGSAARGIARRLRHHGYQVIETESFLVDGSEGPLADGEPERARAWGERLAEVLVHGATR